MKEPIDYLCYAPCYVRTTKGILEGRLGDEYELKCKDKNGNHYSIQLQAVEECKPLHSGNLTELYKDKPMVWLMKDISLDSSDFTEVFTSTVDRETLDYLYSRITTDLNECPDISEGVRDNLTQLLAHIRAMIDEPLK